MNLTLLKVLFVVSEFDLVLVDFQNLVFSLLFPPVEIFQILRSFIHFLTIGIKRQVLDALPKLIKPFVPLMLLKVDEFLLLMFFCGFSLIFAEGLVIRGSQLDG